VCKSESNIVVDEGTSPAIGNSLGLLPRSSPMRRFQASQEDPAALRLKSTGSWSSLSLRQAASPMKTISWTRSRKPRMANLCRRSLKAVRPVSSCELPSLRLEDPAVQRCQERPVQSITTATVVFGLIHLGTVVQEKTLLSS